MAEWLYEAGIGENRAILVEDGAIIEAHIELPGLRAGTVAEARLTSILVSGRRGIATLADRTEVLIEPLAKVTEGATVRIEVVREAIPERGALKRAKGRLTDAEIVYGPDLAARIGTHRTIGIHEPDLFEEASWSECLEEASSGIVTFPGGTLRISLTPAMTLIDVDGALPPYELALAGASATAKAIRRFEISGNIGIDLPTVSGKAERQAISAAFDTWLPRPFERTSVNGFGFLQIIRPRTRASLCEVMQYDPVNAAARALLRRAQRSNIIGASEIIAAPQVIVALTYRPEWVDILVKQLGGEVSLHADSNILISNGIICRTD